ncbi:MAG: hypothetical protein KC416_05860 [Myxococcales bacterium]|nr:hypothetical protein [Myxococcales bacterium]
MMLRRNLGLLVLLVSVSQMLGACSSHHVCEGPELCDGVDNDCDRRVDEDFRDEDGVYPTSAHCGGCGIDCDSMFANSAETSCDVDDRGEARCVLRACESGYRPAGDGACVAIGTALCLACGDDLDCAAFDPSARCEEGECFPACADGCSGLTECGDGDLCRPAGGQCACNDALRGLEVGCLLASSTGNQCAGVRVCGEDGFGACEPALGEQCNGQDDDCDDVVDEDFVDGAGRYVDQDHCGACGVPCVAPGPHMEAVCAADGNAVACEIACEEGFVDVDGVPANGCECEFWDGSGPPPAVGGDADCDGVVDDNDEFIHVTTTGNDNHPGTLVLPMRTISAALARAESRGVDVLVAQGTYAGPVSLAAGVGLFGGYRQDFRDRDPALYPVFLEGGGSPGAPVLRCSAITAATVVDGITVRGSAALAPSQGSTAVYFDRCGPSVVLRGVSVFAAKGADGEPGLDSSDALDALGVTSLLELDGRDGSPGLAAANAGCPTRVGGAGGLRTCPLGGSVRGGSGGDAACPDLGCTNGIPCANAGCTDFTPPGGLCDVDAVLAAAVANPEGQAGLGALGGGPGVSTYNAPTNRNTCNFCDDNPSLPRLGGSGGNGSDGIDGAGGNGCDGIAQFDSGSGRLGGGKGSSGTSGTDGSGGGGGTAGSGYAVIGGTAGSCEDRSGGSGGGGGSGGCGTPLATGGGGGGASIGITIRALTGQGPTFDDVRVVTATGGNGGGGGVGARGGARGLGAPGGSAAFWCSRSGGRGGDGGSGGAGGGGGGGCGGSSHGIYVAGADGAYVNGLGQVTIDQVGIAGRGGRGGFSPGESGTPGSNGNGSAIFAAP